MIYVAPNVALNDQGELPRRYHNAPVTVFGFPEPETLQLVLGGTIAQIAGTNSEFYSITNMSDPTTKVDLHIRIVNDLMPMIVVGSDADLVSQVSVPYGSTAILSRTSNEAEWIFVQIIKSLPLEEPEPRAGGLWQVSRTFDDDVDLLPGFVNLASGAKSANLPIDAKVGAELIVKSVAPSPLQIVVRAGEGQTLEMGTTANIGANGGGAFIYVGENHWIRYA